MIQSPRSEREDRPAGERGGEPGSTRRRIPFAWLAAVYTAFIATIVFAADSGRWGAFFEVVHGVPFGDKVAHFLFLGMLSFLFSAATWRRTMRVGPLVLPKAAIVVIVLAAVEETSQRLFPTRTFDLFDLASNTLGALVGGLLARRMRPSALATTVTLAG